MNTYTLHMVAPMKLKGCYEELSEVKNYCGINLYIKPEGFSENIKQFAEWSESVEVSPDWLLVFDITGEAVDQERAYMELLREVKNVRIKCPNTKVVVALGKEDRLLINEFMKIGVHNLYFVERFSVEDILAALMAPDKTLADLEDYLEQGIRHKEVIVKEVKVPSPPASIPSWQSTLADILSRKPVIEKRPSKEVKEKTIQPKEVNRRMIGFFGSGAGAGTTSLVVALASLWCNQKKRVLILDYSQNAHLLRCKIQLPGATISGEPPHQADLFGKYERILVDFGSYAEVAPEGDTILEAVTQDNILDRELLLKYCDKVVMVGSSDEWQLYKMNFYLTSSVLNQEMVNWLFYFHGSKILSDTVWKNLCNRYLDFRCLRDLSVLMDDLEKINAGK